MLSDVSVLLFTCREVGGEGILTGGPSPFQTEPDLGDSRAGPVQG